MAVKRNWLPFKGTHLSDSKHFLIVEGENFAEPRIITAQAEHSVINNACTKTPMAKVRADGKFFRTFAMCDKNAPNWKSLSLLGKLAMSSQNEYIEDVMLDHGDSYDIGLKSDYEKADEDRLNGKILDDSF